MQTPFRPARVRINDEMGRTRTLDSGATAFECLRAGTEGTLLLGLGPDPAVLAGALRLEPPVFWLECQDFAQSMSQEWHRAIPKDWIRLHAGASLPKTATVWLYRANTRLFPSFWGPITAQVLLSSQAHAPRSDRCSLPESPDAASAFRSDAASAFRPDVASAFRSDAASAFRPDAAEAVPVVLLPGSENQLLTYELEAAFTAEGFTPVRLPVDDTVALRQILDGTRPTLYFSINFRGFDADGLVFHLLRERQVPMAVWMVDNPWHLLSRFRQPWWRQVPLFVTDDWFLPGLTAHGAAAVHHLPLAGWDMDLTPVTPLPETRLTFVGSALFPNKDSFFAGCSIPPELLAEARQLLDSPVQPDLCWWLERLSPPRLWPGNEVRTAGFCADNMSMERRALWLSYAARFGLTVYGDAGWIALLPRTVQCRSPVDYYHGLGAIYAAAQYTLNLTSLQLPHGLTQRHFDVWQAGGFLLTDPTPGLSLFPAELTEPITVLNPSGFRDVMRRLDTDTTLRSDLQSAWRAHIQEHHTYRHRIKSVLCTPPV